MDKNKRIDLVAHDNRKKDLVEWVEWNWEKLINHELTCTGTTGRLVEEALSKILSLKGISKKVKIKKLKSGPLGGDQQLGAMIADGNIDILIFLWDPMQAQPHDVDVKALLRISSLYNIPTAINRATADFMISSDIFEKTYQQAVKDYSDYIMRNVGQ